MGIPTKGIMDWEVPLMERAPKLTPKPAASEKQSMRLGGLVINSDRDKITVEELTPAQEAAIDKEAAEEKATAPEPFISPQTRREMEAGRKQLAANQAHLASLPPRPKDPAEGTMTPVYQPGDLVKRFGTRLG